MPASCTVVQTLLITCFGTAMIQANVGLSSAQPNPPDNSPSLFNEVPPGEKPDLDALANKFHKSSTAAANNFKSTSVRVDYIHLKWDELIVTARALNPTVIRLFKDLSVEFVPQRFTQIPQSANLQGKKERFRWSGKVKAKGQEIGQVVFVVNITDRSITGTIRYQGRAFRIRPLGNDRYEVTELNLTKFPEEHLPKMRQDSGRNPTRNLLSPDRTIRPDIDDGTPVPVGSDESTPEPSPDTMVQPCFINMMVLYTLEAQMASSDIEGEIYEAFVQANVIFENSRVPVMVQPTYIGLLNYPERNVQNITRVLDDVGNGATAIGLDVKILRDQWQADLVSVWVENSGRTQRYCGIGYQSDTAAPSDIDGFTIVRRDCATEMLSFTHEVGHNLGLGHDRYSQGTKGKNDGASNYGHVSLHSAMRDIMATHKECLDSGLECDRLPFFSSPDFTYPDSTEPMGIASGQPDAADNAAIAKQTACLVAHFR